MTFSEYTTKLRARLQDLIRLEVIDHSNFRDLYQATFLEIVIEAERKKRDIEKTIESIRHQLSKEEGKLMALEQIGTIVHSIVDGYCRSQERALEEMKVHEKELREKAELAEKMKLAEEAKLAENVELAEDANKDSVPVQAHREPSARKSRKG